jgi:glycine/D-amino acid oxidase-like deaminating enzyme
VSLSRFGFQFLREASRYLSLDGSPVDLSLHEGGYLYLANDSQRNGLLEAHRVQAALGAEIALLDPDALSSRFPWLNTRDISLGALGLSGEGWFDGPALHQALLAKAIAQGARRIRAEVVEVLRAGSGRATDPRIAGVRLSDGRSLHCDQVVIAAGAWSARLAATLGERLAISAARRSVFVLSTPSPLPDCPLLIDPSGFWLRPEGRYLLTGAPPIEVERDLPLEPDWRELDDAQWERLAHRIPALEAMRIERAWAGYYEMHDFDHNALVGPSNEIVGLWYLCGFSGHGMQHAPGAGLALGEWLLTGQPRTIDISALSPERVRLGRPLIELNVIG